MDMGSSSMNMASSTAAMVMSTASSMVDMGASGTAAAASASGTGMAGMGGMDMGGGTGEHACKISMLWNWYTIDACFLAESWHIRSQGAFAASCIGVILLAISLEGIRRFQREYDRRLKAKIAARGSINTLAAAEGGHSSDGSGNVKNSARVTAAPAQFFRSGSGGQLKLWEHTIRSLLYMVQFAVGFLLMLLGMFFSGYIIICIFIGAFLGAMIFQWDNLSSPELRDTCCA